VYATAGNDFALGGMNEMTLPDERTHAVIEARTFLYKLSVNQRISRWIRQEATRLLRHYPSAVEVDWAARNEVTDPKLVIEPIFSPREEL
jgi:hypothetical protein